MTNKIAKSMDKFYKQKIVTILPEDCVNSLLELYSINEDASVAELLEAIFEEISTPRFSRPIDLDKSKYAMVQLCMGDFNCDFSGLSICNFYKFLKEICGDKACQAICGRSWRELYTETLDFSDQAVTFANNCCYFVDEDYFDYSETLSDIVEIAKKVLLLYRVEKFDLRDITGKEYDALTQRAIATMKSLFLTPYRALTAEGKYSSEFSVIIQRRTYT